MRAIWKGAVSFGLVSVPVKLYSATESHDVSFRQVHAKDGGRIKYQRVCSIDGEEVAYADIAKGYETEDGEMVILTDDDMAELPSTSSREISVEKFVPSDQIDPMLFEKAYYLEPEKTGAKPYGLLRQALVDSDRMAVVTVALRQRTSVAVLRVRDDVIVLQTMMWPDEIRKPDFSVETGDVKPAEVKMANMLVETLAGDFDATEFEDDYAGAVESLVKAKIEGGEVKRTETSTKSSGEVVDLLAALQRSVDAAKTARGESSSEADEKPAAKKSAKKAPAKKTAAKKVPRRRLQPRRLRPRRPADRMTTAVRTDVDADGVAVLTLDGPGTLNAISADTARRLSEAYRSCDADDHVRVVVVTGAGRAFSSGADMSIGSDAFAVPDASFTASPFDPPAWQVRKLVIAAVNGPAIGIGLTLALQCDLRFVASDAQLAIPQVRRGVIGDAQSHHVLRRIAGTAVAADLLLTGRTITGQDAVAYGMANEALPAADVLPAALDRARDVALHASPAAVALSKAILWSDLTLEQVGEAETAAHHLLMGHPDVAEGPAAWRERRRPEWGLRVSDLPGEPY